MLLKISGFFFCFSGSALAYVDFVCSSDQLSAGMSAASSAVSTSSAPVSQIGLMGLAVMGQNLALNIAEKGYKISVYNRSYSKTETAVKKAQEQKLDHNLRGFKEISDFVNSIQNRVL